MSLSFFIARRYLFSKQSHNAINIISAIAMGGVAVATIAMICVLSVFNGFRDLIATLYTTFDPQGKGCRCRRCRTAQNPRAEGCGCRFGHL